MGNEILVLVKYTVKPGLRMEFLKRADELGIIWDSKAEPGNLKYEYSLSLESGNDVILTELWADGEAIAVHRDTPHYEKLMELKKQYVTDTGIDRYSVTRL
jgi:quinol monooxygenase YgiN